MERNEWNQCPGTVAGCADAGKRLLVVGGTSGIGRAVAERYLEMGWRVAVTGRRGGLLEQMETEAAGRYGPGRLVTCCSDVTETDFVGRLESAVSALGGMDLCLYSAGYGRNNLQLEPEVEDREVTVNAAGFVRCAVWCFRYWGSRPERRGRLAVVSSIAGIRPLGVSAGYSATKHFQAFYLDALRQLAVARSLRIGFTSIHPGFVDTDFIRGHRYPMTLSPEKAARIIVRGLERGRRRIYADGRWGAVACLMRLFPARLWTALGVFFRGRDEVFPED